MAALVLQKFFGLLKRKKTRLIRILIYTFVFANIGLISLFVFHEVFNFTSSNSAIYVLKGKTGGIELSRDLSFEDVDRLFVMLDANCVFSYFMRGLAVARHEPLLELTWDSEKGIGDIKQFRHDGTILSLTFSRFKEDGVTPGGLFLGGELPYGDTSMEADHDTSGFGYYDGEKWLHIWCAANEGMDPGESSKALTPVSWKYMGSSVLKDTDQEVMLRSEHEASLKGNKIRMTRLVYMRTGDDYFILKVRLTNASSNPVSYGYAYGDEPWIGHFGGSEGDVGWYEGGLIKYEIPISPIKYKYAGYWDYGNDAAGEGHKYTGYANFIEWISPTPSYAFFSNNINYCCTDMLPLFAQYNRVINVAWTNQVLQHGESKDYILAIGMAKVDPSTGFPRKPDVRLSPN